jgi:uncharacterized protein with HEPN domain
MREQRNDPKRLRDILQAIDTIFQYVDGRDMEAFVADKKSYHAVIYNIMIIGEAANMLTPEFQEAHPETPWKMVKGMRNYIVHEYFQIDSTVVWDVVSNELATLRQQIEKYISDTDWKAWEQQEP